MTSILKWLLVTAALLPLASHGDTPLLPSKAQYETGMGMINATGERLINPDGGSLWRVTNDASVMFLTFRETAVAAINDYQVVPVSYHYENPVSKRKNMLLRFDWDAAILSQSEYKPRWQLPLEGPVYDKLSYQLQMRLDAIRHGADYPATDYSVVIKRNKIGTYHVEYQGEEILDSKAGKLRTAKFLLTRRDRRTEVWLAKDWNYLLVRSEQHEKDQDDYTVNLLEGAVDGKKITAAP